MERLKFLAIGVLIIGIMFLGSGQVFAAIDLGCNALGGDDSTGECVISGAATAPGLLTIGETLHLLNGAVITVLSPRPHDQHHGRRPRSRHGGR